MKTLIIGLMALISLVVGLEARVTVEPDHSRYICTLNKFTINNETTVINGENINRLNTVVEFRLFGQGDNSFIIDSDGRRINYLFDLNKKGKTVHTYSNKRISISIIDNDYEVSGYKHSTMVFNMKDTDMMGYMDCIRMTEE